MFRASKTNVNNYFKILSTPKGSLLSRGHVESCEAPYSEAHCVASTLMPPPYGNIWTALPHETALGLSGSSDLSLSLNTRGCDDDAGPTHTLQHTHPARHTLQHTHPARNANPYGQINKAQTVVESHSTLLCLHAVTFTQGSYD